MSDDKAFSIATATVLIVASICLMRSCNHQENVGLQKYKLDHAQKARESK